MHVNRLKLKSNILQELLQNISHQKISKQYYVITEYLKREKKAMQMVMPCKSVKKIFFK